MPVTFAESPDGTVLIADGLGPVLEWDGFDSQATPAGTPRPVTAPVIAGVGAGALLGTYAAYVRFVDKRGRVSDLSPVSNELVVVGTSGAVVGASNTSPIILTTSSAHGLSSGARVRVVGVGGNTGANGVWEVEVVDTLNLRLLTSTGGGAYTTGGSWSSGATAIGYSSIPVSNDIRVVARQLLRNTDGQFQTFYVDAELSDLNATTFNSTRTDVDLATQEAVVLVSDDGADLANRHAEPPQHKRIIARHQAFMFLAGEVEYSEGSVRVINGDNRVQGLGTEWKKALGSSDTVDGPVLRTGRYLYVVGADQAYFIEAVDVSDQILFLDRPYLGATDKYATYSIRTAAAEERIVRWCEPGLPGSWPEVNAVAMPDDGDQVTGLMSKSSFLYIVERRHIYRFTFDSDPALDGAIFLQARRGCVNDRCWALVEGAAYMLDEQGIHVFGAGENGSVSTPIQTMFRDDFPSRINWAASRYFHCTHDPSLEMIRWFVAMSGQYLPRHAICYQYTTKRWQIEEYPRPVGSSILGKLSRTAALGTWGFGREQVFLGSTGRRIQALGHGYLDGIDADVRQPSGAAAAMSGAVSSAGIMSLTASTAFSPAAVNCPLAITRGRGRGQMATIVSVSGSTVTLAQPWSVRPDASSYFQVGAVPWRWRSGWLRWAEEEDANRRRLRLEFEPTTQARDIFVKRYRDRRDVPLTLATTRREDGVEIIAGADEIRVQTNRPSGSVAFSFDNSKEALTPGPELSSVGLSGYGGSEPMRVYEVRLEGAQGGG